MKKIDYKTIIPILAIVIIQIAFAIVITNKVVELENKIDKIKLLNGMFFEDMEESRKLIDMKTSSLMNEISQLKEENENLLSKCIYPYFIIH